MGGVQNVSQAGGIDITDRNTDRIAGLILGNLLVLDGILQLSQDDLAQIVFDDQIGALLQCVINGEIDISAVF